MSGNAELVAAVQALHQDHGWIEENWIELGPQLRAIALGNNWFDTADFVHGVEVFLTLMPGPHRPGRIPGLPRSQGAPGTDRGKPSQARTRMTEAWAVNASGARTW